MPLIKKNNKKERKEEKEKVYFYSSLLKYKSKLLSWKSLRCTEIFLSIFTPKTSVERYDFLCALWHCLISSSDQCPTSSFIQTNVLIFSILGCLICSLSAKMSQTAIYPLLDHMFFTTVMASTSKISILKEPYSRHELPSPQTLLVARSSVTHEIDIFNCVVLGTKELNKINLHKVISHIFCLLCSKRVTRISQIRPMSD